MKYIQWNADSVDANGIAPIFCVVTTKGEEPDWPTQLVVDDYFEVTGLAIDTINMTTVQLPPGPPEE